MDHMAQVAAQPESVANAEQSIPDYISVIRGEALRAGGAQQDELLLAAQRKYQEKKGYMEERP
jgi:DNA primase